MIEVVGVTKRYGNTTVVDNVSATIQKGGITSIIGPNGAGKSTLLAMMSRLLKMDAGKVFVEGSDVSKTASNTLAKRLAILRQDNHVAVRLTVRDLVTFGRYPYSKGRPTLDDLEIVEQALEHMSLSDLSERFLDELSGGQRQRAFVAMVLCQDTDYLLLDEPLNNLDMKHAVSMMRRLRDIADGLAKTIVLVIHDINFASCYSDEIIAMKDGCIVHKAQPKDLMTADVLRNIYDLEVNVQTIGEHAIGIYYR